MFPDTCVTHHPGRSLVIDLLAIADGPNFHDVPIIVELVDDAVVANADPPQVTDAAKLLATRRRGVSASASMRGKMRWTAESGKRSKSLRAERTN